MSDYLKIKAMAGELKKGIPHLTGQEKYDAKCLLNKTEVWLLQFEVEHKIIPFEKKKSKGKIGGFSVKDER